MHLASVAYQLGQLLGVGLWVLLIVAAVRHFRHKDGTPSTPPPLTASNRYGGLRQWALGAVSNGLEAPRAEHPDVSGVVVDIPRADTYVTVVAMTDGTTNLYTSTGGTTFGTGGQASLAAVSRDLLSTAQALLPQIAGPDDLGLPPPGRVRFHVLTPSGTRREDVPEDAFWGRAPHELVALIAATQRVLLALGATTPEMTTQDP